MNSFGGVRIRPAVPDDADLLARLHTDVWEDAYGDLMPTSVFEQRRATILERVDRWRQILDGAASSTAVAEVTGALVGFASIGPPRDDDVTVDEELWATADSTPRSRGCPLEVVLSCGGHNESPQLLVSGLRTNCARRRGGAS